MLGHKKDQSVVDQSEGRIKERVIRENMEEVGMQMAAEDERKLSVRLARNS